MAHRPFRVPKLAGLFGTQWLRAPAIRYGLATLLTIAAVLVRLAFDRWLGNSAVFATIFPVIAFCAFFLGLGPAVLSIALGLVGANFLVTLPKHAFSLTPFDYMASLAYVATAAALVVVVAEASRRSYRRLEQAETALHASEARAAEKAKSDAVKEERNRLSREIHDTCAQGLTGIILQLEAAEESLAQNPEDARGCVISARELARESLKEVRASVWNLHSHSLGSSNLQSAIEQMAQKVFWGARVDLSVLSRGTVRPLSEETEFGLLRISQEALTNALRHSKASKIRVELSYEPNHVRISIEDNGRGFIPAGPRTNGLGLTSMRERAEGIEGEWSIKSAPGQGTRIQVVVPIPTQGAQRPKYATA